MIRILVLHGPNLNMLGTREPLVYGTQDLSEIETSLAKLAGKLGHQLKCFQSNAEHEIVDRIQQAATDKVGFILINPGAFTHTSIATRDALLAVNIPFIEVHLSNTFAREEFRHKSYFSDVAKGCIVGLGAYGYELALRAAVRQLEHAKEK